MSEQFEPTDGQLALFSPVTEPLSETEDVQWQPGMTISWAELQDTFGWQPAQFDEPEESMSPIEVTE
jgi:hypothetical protein